MWSGGVTDRLPLADRVRRAGPLAAAAGGRSRCSRRWRCWRRPARAVDRAVGAVAGLQVVVRHPAGRIGGGRAWRCTRSRCGWSSACCWSWPRRSPSGASPAAPSRPWCRPACSWPPRPSCRCTRPALTAVALAVALALTGLVHLSARSVVLASGAGAVLAAALAAEVWTAGHLLDAAPGLGRDGRAAGPRCAGPRGAVRCRTAGGSRTPRCCAAPGWRPAPPPPRCRSGLAGVLLAARLGRRRPGPRCYLTVAGVAGDRDVPAARRPARAGLGRRRAAGAGQLGAAVGPRRAPARRPTRCRRRWPCWWSAGVHLRRRPDAGTMTALGARALAGPGAEPAVGARRPDRPARAAARPGLPGAGAGRRCGCAGPPRWPLGATVGALLVLRLAAPYVGDAVPRWVLIGGAGALLIAVGATWERRLADARHAGRLRPRAALSARPAGRENSPRASRLRGPSPRPLPVPLASAVNRQQTGQKLVVRRPTDLGSQSSSLRRCSGTIPVSRSRTSDSR